MSDYKSIHADLHLHTTASDGLLEPYQLIKVAADAGLNVIAITDHDTVDGVLKAIEAGKSTNSITIIPGVEINTDVPQTEVHMLGYFINFRDKILLSTLSDLRDSRIIRAKQMVEKLNILGKNIKFERVSEMATDGAIGRPHIAQALVEAGYVSSFQEAFEKYIGRQGPAYVEHKKMIPSEVVKLILGAGGIPVLAHPDNIPDLENLIQDLIPRGLMGIETFYGNYQASVIDRLSKLASKYGLLTTGGSDYHGFNNENETGIGKVIIPEQSLISLFELAKKHNPQLVDQYGLSIKN